ncbi:unnamed protein product [Arabis nemorensis]|uniref:Uncharacterized protein n=1 Tax=Arabis nemorensis TaxID=586526 RepID=A0A565B7I4_9BRAS|nr:unnamed protein product [Arabis nemorensis]
MAVDINKSACSSLELNHPETEVRNETAEDFLILLKEWRRLCQKFGLISTTEPLESDSDSEDDDNDVVEEESNGSEMPPDEFEVGELLSICYENPKNKEFASALHFKKQSVLRVEEENGRNKTRRSKGV